MRAIATSGIVGVPFPPLGHEPSPVAALTVDGVDPQLVARAARAVASARGFAMRIQRSDGHWCAELESNTTITAEYVFMRQALGLDLDRKRDGMVRYFFAQQKADGSWGLATNHVGDVSTTAETYLALRLLGIATDDARMRDAERYILAHGGLEKMRVFTRIFFAMFGLFPWSAVPSLPPEFILLPPSSPVNVYALSSWARGTIVPLLILLHHKPLFALSKSQSARSSEARERTKNPASARSSEARERTKNPESARSSEARERTKNLDSPQNDWLDHLWLDPTHKDIPYSEPLARVLRETGASWTTFFTAVDRVLGGYEGLVRRVDGPLGKLRRYALKRCEEWMLERQEDNGDWGGIFPPMLNTVLAFFVNGHSMEEGPLALGLEAIERFSVDDAAGFRIEPCQSPVWDTVLMMIGLVDSGPQDPALARVRDWLARRQILEEHGDWRVYNPAGQPGGWSFEYANTWYPDVDDTAAVVIAFLKQDPSSRTSECVTRAVEWIVSMQNKDGGWAAFDKQNDKLFLNEIPFSDMDSLCDPSTPDIVGRVLEALGIVNDPKYRDACARGIAYLRASQEPEGSWFGRWGVNYVYGSSNVLTALARQGIAADDTMVVRAIAWLRSVQNDDGGWGECLESYSSRALMGRGGSTASQTAWALMALLAYVPREDSAVRRGIQWLVDRQTSEGSWDEEAFTGTGFPKHFYLRYNLYRHYFPLMALGRFVASEVR
jgi:squalene-hopene/tetraprenyl-beta-curcumene cyclase